MHTIQFNWTWRGTAIDLGVDISGQGPTVVLLPALSSISTRREMWPLQRRLGSHYRTIAVDWPGFGDQARPPVDWKPAAYAAFLNCILAAIAPSPHAVIAAGHAATYALAQACAQPASVGRLVLVAPTWRGPLPTMMNGRRPFLSGSCKLVDLPVFGQMLYKLNVNRLVVRYMAAGHVYAEPSWLDDRREREKLAVVRSRGARFASVRFVTGELDPLETREQFVDLARQATIPMLMVYGEQTPQRSRAEMQALATVSAMQSVCIPRGKLALHEEFAEEVAQIVAPFLACER
jgi:pimeloyl-ACP methyl ester carboxylesterase